jgi:type VI protein secretion system component VasF
MNDEQRDKSAERWLDSALDRYSDAEPRPGFETRLLATITCERERRTRKARLWTWAAVTVAAAAVVVIVVGLSMGRHTDERPAMVANTSPAAANEVPPQPTPNAGTTLTHAAGPDHSIARKPVPRIARPPAVVAAANRSVPKQPQFPTPAPLSEQERLLLAYVRYTPKQEIEAVLEQKQAFEKHVDELGVPQEQEKNER